MVHAHRQNQLRLEVRYPRSYVVETNRPRFALLTMAFSRQLVTIARRRDQPLKIGMISQLVQLCAVTLLYLAASGPAQAESCRSESFEGASYIVCSFDLTKDDLRIY